MEIYLNMPIKEVITKFPEVGRVLEEYGIGCVPCNVGSCLLKDIIEIHNLSEEDERIVMGRITQQIYPDREIPVASIRTKGKPQTKALRYSPPVQKLVDEHVLIKRWIALIPKVLEDLDIESPEGRRLILDGVDFIRSYADKFHHAKEEDILFKYFDERLDIIRTMLEDHQAGRNHVRSIVEGVETNDKKKIAHHLDAYRELLTEHIKKEDEILYPWMERGLSMKQVGELFSKFNDIDGTSGQGVTEKCRRFVIETEQKVSTKKEV